ncbi:serine hydrolase domain-containing protein [Lysobacter korlensis]|uniref:Serine hydrolase domain-containing protein n=1 Tax=Lysobacter korlensis TaxID=553636 RepID=A0ABV6RNP0_9GAMM
MPPTDLESLARTLHDTAVQQDFSGAISLDADGDAVLAQAYGLADRAHGIPNALETRFGTASVSKGFTALAIHALIEDGSLELDTPVRSVLGEDLSVIDDGVTVQHLLEHTSGIGDYLDESDDLESTDYVLTVPTHTLANTESFLSAIDGHPQVSPPGERFAYNNGGYIVLALVAERVAGVGFHELVARRVFEPAGMTATGYLRLDELPGDAAVGYLGIGDRTNVLHLPVRGNGDGGAYTTAGDLSRFWRSLTDGRILPQPTVAEVLRPRRTVEEEGMRYGRGFWIDLTKPDPILIGGDAGVSIVTRFDPATRTTMTIVSNTPDGAWPLYRAYRNS